MELYGSIQSISGSMTASVFTGSFKGDGSGLYNIPASGVTGLNLSQITTGSVTASVSTDGFNINSNTSITGSLKVKGTIIAEQIDVTIYSSSVLFQSGSSRFGDSLDDTHNITGSVNITGSISLNGQPIGTGKLDETIFNTYTASNNPRVTLLENSTSSLNSYTSSANNRFNSIETSTGSLNSFSSSVNSFTISLNSYTTSTDGRLSSIETSTGSLNSFSSSINSFTTSLNSYTTSTDGRLSSIETSTGSLNSFTSSIYTTIKNKLNSETVVSGSIQVNITGTTGYNTFSSSIATTDSLQESRLSSLENTTGSLNTFSSSTLSRLTNIETSTSSLNTFSSSTSTRLNNLENSSGSIRNDFNSYTSSNDSTNTAQNNRLDLLESTSGSLNNYTSSNSTRLGIIEGTTASLNSYTSSTNNRLNTIETATSSLNSFTSSINTTIKNKLNNDGVISGSVQVDITQTTNYTSFSASLATTDLNQTNKIGAIESTTASLNTFTSSTDGRLNSLESTSGSLNSYTSSNNTRLGVIESTTSSLNTFTSSANSRLNSLESASGSIRTDFNTFTSSANGRLNSLETASGSIRTDFNTFTSSYTTVSGSLDSRLDVLEAYSSSQQVPTASYSLRTTQTDVYCQNNSGYQINKGQVVRIVGAVGDNPLIATASYINDNNSANTLGIATENIANGANGLVITEGVLVGVNTLGMTAGELIFLGATGSFINTAPIAPLHAVRLGEVLRVNQNNGSVYVRIDNGIELDEAHDVVYTNISQGDLLVRNSGGVWSNSKSLNGNYSLTGSMTISGSQTVVGTQTVSGSLIVLQDLQVFGSSSITYVTASQLALSTSFISVNVFEPAERFGGLKVYDSGSLSHQATASLAWDSLNNRWVYQNASGSSYSGGMLISGPRNSGSLGDEPSLTSGKIPKSVGGDHIDNSIMNETAGVIYITGSLSATGTVYGTNITAIEATTSSLNSYTASNDSTNTTQNNRLSALETSTSSLNTFTSSAGSRLTSIETSTSSLNSFTSSTNNRLSSIETSTGSLNSYTSSNNTRLNSIETSTGSLNSYTSSTNTRLSSIETSTGSLNSFTSSINTTIKNRLNAENVYSSSAQVVSSLPAGTVSGSSQVLVGTTIHSGSFFNGITVVSGSGQISFNGITDKPTLVSGSSQIAYSSISGIPSGIVSGSSQITYSSISGIPSGIVSGSSQITFGSISGVPSGLVSGSSQISFGSISNVPSGLVSGSSQITLSSTTGFGTYLDQAVKSGSTVTFSTVTATTFTGALSGNASTVTNGVYTTGTQTIAGEKTFSDRIIYAKPLYRSFDTFTGADDSRRTKTYSGVLVAASDISGAEAYTIIDTNVPQDNYQMGGFTIEIMMDYQNTNNKTKVDLCGYWNPESNGGFVGWEAHFTNAGYTPTIQVARKTSTGNVSFIISNSSASYQIIVARDLWLGYNESTAESTEKTWGDDWAIIQSANTTAYTNIDTVVNRSSSVSAGTGISVNKTTNDVTVTNTGTLTVAGTSNQVLVNGSTAAANGNITLSLPQSIATSSSPTFAGITSSAGITVSGTGYYTFNKPSTASYQTVALFGTTSGGVFITSDNAIISKGAYYNNGWIATSTAGSLIDLTANSNQPGIATFSGATVGNGVTFSTTQIILHAGNYNSYSPTLTGTGASGTWGINVTGSAGSVAWTNVTSRPTALSSFTNDVVARPTLNASGDFQYGAQDLAQNNFSQSSGTSDTDQFGRYYYSGSSGSIWSRYLPVDKGGKYRMKIRWKASAGSTTYVAVILLDTNGNNINGAGTYWAYPFSGGAAPTSWTTNEYWYDGSAFPSNAAYVAFGISHTNYGGGSATYYVSQLEIERYNTQISGNAILHAGNYSSYSSYSTLTLSSTLNLPNNALVSVNSEPDTWGARFRTTTSTANLGGQLKNIIWCGGGSVEGFAVTGTGTGSASFEVRNDGRAWIKENLTVGGTLTENSSIRYKKDIEKLKYGINEITQLRGVTYIKKQNNQKEIGVIAEEIAKILPELVNYDSEGNPDSVSYGRITAVLIEAIKDLKSEIEVLKQNR